MAKREKTLFFFAYTLLIRVRYISITAKIQFEREVGTLA